MPAQQFAKLDVSRLSLDHSSLSDKAIHWKILLLDKFSNVLRRICPWFADNPPGAHIVAASAIEFQSWSFRLVLLILPQEYKPSDDAGYPSRFTRVSLDVHEGVIFVVVFTSFISFNAKVHSSFTRPYFAHFKGLVYKRCNLQ
jgi:hypothetical protein